MKWENLSTHIITVLQDADPNFLSMYDILDTLNKMYLEEISSSTFYDYISRLVDEKSVEHQKGKGYRIYQEWQAGRNLLLKHLPFFQNINALDILVDEDSKGNLILTKDFEVLDKIPKKIQPFIENFKGDIEKLIHFGFLDQGEEPIPQFRLSLFACNLLNVCPECYMQIPQKEPIFQYAQFSKDEFYGIAFIHDTCVYRFLHSGHIYKLSLRKRRKKQFPNEEIPEMLSFNFPDICSECGLPLSLHEIFPDANNPNNAVLSKELYGNVKTIYWAKNIDENTDNQKMIAKLSKLIRIGNKFFHPMCAKSKIGGDNHV